MAVAAASNCEGTHALGNRISHLTSGSQCGGLEAA